MRCMARIHADLTSFGADTTVGPKIARKMLDGWYQFKRAYKRRTVRICELQLYYETHRRVKYDGNMTCM